MQKTIDALKELAGVDTQLVRLKKVLDLGPQELAGKEKEVEDIRGERDAVNGRIRACAAEIDRLALEVKTAEQELIDLERKMGIVKNTKEYQIVSGRTDELKKIVAQTEGRELELMAQLEGLRAELGEVNGRIAAGEAELAQIKARVEREAVEIKQQQQALAAQRSVQIAKVREVAPEALAVYGNSLKRGKGLALAEVKAGICQSCFRRLQPNVINIVAAGQYPERCICGGCGKILYTDSAEGAEC